jgi:hypothetical protein
MVQIIKTIETEEMLIQVRSDKIVSLTVKVKHLTAFATIKYIIKTVLANPPYPLPLVFDVRKTESISDFALNLLTSHRMKHMTLCLAMIVTYPATEEIRGLINNVMLESKIKYPTKIFTDEKEAINWIKQYAPKDWPKKGKL